MEVVYFSQAKWYTSPKQMVAAVRSLELWFLGLPLYSYLMWEELFSVSDLRGARACRMCRVPWSGGPRVKVVVANVGGALESGWCLPGAVVPSFCGGGWRQIGVLGVKQWRGVGSASGAGLAYGGREVVTPGFGVGALREVGWRLKWRFGVLLREGTAECGGLGVAVVACMWYGLETEEFLEFSEASMALMFINLNLLGVDEDIRVRVSYLVWEFVGGVLTEEDVLRYWVELDGGGGVWEVQVRLKVPWEAIKSSMNVTYDINLNTLSLQERGRISRNLLDRVVALAVLSIRASQSRQHDTLVRLPMDIRLKIDLENQSDLTSHLPRACLMLAQAGFPSSL
ncbi:hypothetical protein Tco_1133565 [Tanacetum coccineum]